MPGMGENPSGTRVRMTFTGDEPVPRQIELAPDYSADLPLWGCDGSGNISWQDTKFSPRLLDRLAAWQQDFDANFHWDTGWRSTAVRDHWHRQIGQLAADVRAELGDRAELIVRLWQWL
jgi:hypothetical protein